MGHKPVADLLPQRTRKVYPSVDGFFEDDAPGTTLFSGAARSEFPKPRPKESHCGAVIACRYCAAMTYTVIARCARTNQIGMGVATYSIACGSFTQGAQSPYGISMSQANVRKGNAVLATNMLAQGYGSQSVLDALVRDDPHEAYRQVGVMTRTGHVAVHTGRRVSGWCGELHGQDYLVFGNVLAGGVVVEAMRDALLSHPELPLAERLIRSLECGRDAGGQAFEGTHVRERSASLMVVDRRSYADWDLRVDLHNTAVDELRRLYEVFKPYQPYYNDRDDDPSRTPGQLAWERAQGISDPSRRLSSQSE